MAMLGKAKREVLHLLPVVVFFFLAFNIVAVCHGLMTRGYTKWATGFALATALALVVGKGIVVAEALPFLEAFRARPLIYPTVWKASVYIVVALLLRYLELLGEAFSRFHGIDAANHRVFAETNWPRFWAVEIILAIFLCAYAGLSELSRAMGPGELRKAFFGHRQR